MKALWKFLVVGIVAVLLAILLVSIVLPGEYSSREELEIRVPGPGAFRVLSSFETFPDWYFEPDFEGDIQISTIDGTARSRIDWSGGEREDRGALIHMELGPDRSRSANQKLNLRSDRELNQDYMDLESFLVVPVVGGMVRIDWESRRIWNFPYNIPAWWSGYEETHLDKHRAAATRLEEYLSARFPTNVFDGFEVIRTHENTLHLLVSEVDTVDRRAGGFSDELLDDLAEYVGKNNLNTAGMPMGLIYSLPGTDSVLQRMAIPMADSLPGRKFQYIRIPGGASLQVNYSGDWRMGARAGAALDSYIETYDVVTREPLLKQYFYDPKIHLDASTWRTRLIVFLE